MSGLPTNVVELVAGAAEGRAPLGPDAEFELAQDSGSLGWLSVVDGQVSAGAEGTGNILAVKLPLTDKVIDGWLSGSTDLSVAYMRGDLKPDGATGALVVALELLDDPVVRAAVAAGPA